MPRTLPLIACITEIYSWILMFDFTTDGKPGPTTGAPIKQRMIDLVIVFVVVCLVMFLGSLSGEILDLLAGPWVKQIDPQDYFLFSAFIYLCSLLVTLVILVIVLKKDLSDWGFNLQASSLSIKVFLVFCLIYTPLIFFTKVVPDAHAVVTAGNSIDRVGIMGSLINHLLISGLYQEVLFRGFVMVFLSRSWSGEWSVGNIQIPYTAFWATLIFILAHFRWGQDPLFYGWQVLWSLILGVYYGIMFHRTKSLLNPILSHSYSNAIYVALLIGYSKLL